MHKPEPGAWLTPAELADLPDDPKARKSRIDELAQPHLWPNGSIYKMPEGDFIDPPVAGQPSTPAQQAVLAKLINDQIHNAVWARLRHRTGKSKRDKGKKGKSQAHPSIQRSKR